MTIGIIALTSILSLLGLSYSSFLKKCLLIPSLLKENSKENYRLISAALVHGSIWHLFANMFTLWYLGTIVEGQMGDFFYLIIYFCAILTSSFVTYKIYQNNTNYSSLGASGGVSGIAYAFIVCNPKAGLGLFLIPVYLPAWIFGLLFIAISSYLLTMTKNRINHLAHIVGALTGAAIAGMVYYTR